MLLLLAPGATSGSSRPPTSRNLISGRDRTTSLTAPKCYIKLPANRIREETALMQAEADAQKIGAGVTTEAQSIFYALGKRLQVQWDKNAIVVMKEVRLCRPCLPDNVRWRRTSCQQSGEESGKIVG